MHTRASRHPLRVIPVAFALIFNVLIGPVAPLLGPAMNGVVHAAGEPVITQDSSPNGCNGVVTTPGSENTLKRFVSGSLEPGGTATFDISFPVDAADVNGDFRITDCVLIGGVAVAKYFVDFVPNNENFILTFTLNVPSDAPIGSEYCNYAKTTESPSASQASNRKAGPACFIVGGALRVLKVDGAGAPLPGATFDIDCDFPTSSAALATTVISAPDAGSVSDGSDANTSNDAHESFASTSGGSLNASATTGSDGAIDVQAPVGTACAFTETAAPSGYLLPDDADVTLTVVAGQQRSHTFVNVRENPALGITKTADQATVNAGEPIGFTINVDSTGTTPVKAATLNDPLPTGTGVSWSISPAYAGPGSCSIGANQVLGCTFGDLAPGAAASVHLVSGTSADSCRTYANTATADGDNVAPITAQASTTVDCAELDLQKTPDGGSVNAGDDISFTLTLTNNGDGAAANVDIDDALPAGFSWSEDPDLSECSITGGNLHCDIASLASGASFAVTVSAPTDGADCSTSAYRNHATADADNHAEVGDDGDVTVTCGNVVLTKSPDLPGDAGGTVNAGSVATFTITVQNTGAGTAHGVHVEDQLPDVSGSWAVDNTGCTIDGSNLLACDLGDMAPSASMALHLTTTVGSEDCGTLSNPLATATTANDGSSHDSGSIEVSCPSLQITKTTDTPTVTAGGTVRYTITVDNSAGDGAAEGVTVHDALPAGLAWSEDSADCSITGSALSCGPLDIAAGASFGVTLTGTTDAADCPSIGNFAGYASANAGSGSTESTPTVITVNCPNLTITKSADEGTISAGDRAAYTIVVTNDGPGAATDVHVDEQLPAGVAWDVAVDDPAPAGGCDSSDTPSGPQSITCDFASLAEGASVTIHLSGWTDPDDCGTLHNVATVAGGNEDPQRAADNAASADLVVECPGLNVAKSAVDDRIDGGDVAAFEIVVWNTGPGVAHDVTISDELPDGLDWSENSAACSIASGVLSCSFGDLDVVSFADSAARVTVSAATTRESCGNLVNLAVAQASNGEGVQDDATIRVDCPKVAIEKTNDAAGTVLPGTNVTYTLMVSVTDGSAKGVTVVDTLPAGLDAPTGISNGGSYDASQRTITWQLGDVAAGNLTLTYQARVSLDVPSGSTLRNVAVVFSPNTQCPGLATLGPDCTDDSTLVSRTPGLVIDKAADTEQVDVTDGEDTMVTWSLTYTLTDGPVTNAVISDAIPAGLDYVAGSASDGGVYDPATRTVSWAFASLTASGSVSFETTVDASIGGGVVIENVATIDSDETPADDGQDSIRTVEQQEEAAVSTPRPSVPDTAYGPAGGGQPLNGPVGLMVVLFIASLSGLAAINLKAVRGR